MESRKEIYKRKLKELAGSDRFVPGIYNYCDRWCERCTMTNRCLSYAREKEMTEGVADPEANDLKNGKFWEQLRLSWEVAMELLYEGAQKHGIDLDNLPDVEIPEHITTHAEKLATQYGDEMHDWFKTHNLKLKEKAEQLLIIKNSDEEALKFADAWEVLQYYFFFIGPKVHRAYIDLDNSDEEDEFDFMSDNLGSAKIAIIAIDRSIGALMAMYPILSDYEDDILKFMALLSKIKKLLLETFPTVMEFKRPGFDDDSDSPQTLEH
jgi:hypothetical protein